MPYAVAITRFPRLASGGGYRTSPSERAPSLDLFLTSLTTLLGMTAFDVRARLAGEAPWVVARTRAAEEAGHTVQVLRDAGFGAVRCDVAAARAWTPPGDAALALDDEGLTVTPAGLRIPYDEVRVVLAATIDAERQTEDIARVVVARNARGTPIIADVSSFRYEREQHRALYLMTRDERPAVRLAQDVVRRGDARGATVRERFEQVVATLRERAPAASYDDRLVTRPRRRSSYVNLANAGERRGAVTSNVAETDLAAWLIATALAERQIG